MKKLLIGLFFFSMILAGCGDSSNSSESSNTTTHDTSSTEYSKEPFVAESYSTGIPFDSFQRSPDENKGNKTMFVAKVFQVVQAENEDDIVQYMATVTPEKNKSVTVMLGKIKKELETNIIKDDEIRVWAKSLGEIEYETSSGSLNAVPAFYIDAYEIVN